MSQDISVRCGRPTAGESDSSSDVSMRTHLSRTVSSCFATLRQLRSMRRSTSQALLLSLVVRWCCRAWTMATRRSPVYQATSSTDYSLWWTPLQDLFALRESTSTSPRYSVTFTGCRCQSGEFKLSVLVFRCLHGTAPSYLASLSEHLFTISCCTFLRGINVNVWTLAIAPLESKWPVALLQSRK